MKNKFHVFFLFLLLAFLTSSAWAEDVYVSENGQTVIFSGRDTVDVDMSYVVTTFTVSQIKDVCASCTGTMVIEAPADYGIVIEGTITLAQGTRLVAYDGYSTHYPKIYDWTNPYASVQERVKWIFSGRGAFIQIINTYGSNNASAKVSFKVTAIPRYRLTTNKVPYNYDVVYKPYSTTEFISDPLGYGEKYTPGVWIHLFTRDTLGATATLKVRRQDNGALVPTFGDGDKLKFLMPAADVDIEYVSISSYSDTINLDLLCKERTINLRKEMKILKIYDNGGSSDNYTDSCDASLNLVAPEGYNLRLTGTVTTEASPTDVYDYLQIYNGIATVEKYSTSSNSPVSVGTITSVNRVMSLTFHSDGSVNAAGLDLTAEVLGDAHTVTVASVSNGSVTPSSFGARTGGVVTLTAKPNSGYVLKSVRVKTPSGDTVRATSSWKTSKIEFTMPNSNVTVTPTFAPDTYSITKSTPTGGTLTVASSAKLNSTVSITATPASGYMLKDVVVKDANGNILKLVKKDFTSMTFTMPMSNVTVSPTWTTDWSADSGLYVNMPKKSKSTLTIPAGVKSFKILDSIGYNYGDTLVLKAPAGHVLQWSGSITLGGYHNDSLLVYSGSVIRADSLIGKNRTNRSQSKGETMMFLFNGYGDSGLNLTVKVIKLELQQGKDGDSVYVNMFYQRKMTFEIPDTLKSFKVYDEGGKDGAYGKNNRDTLVLKAPAGYVLQLSGSVATYYSSHRLTVYSGIVGNADTLRLGTYYSPKADSTISISGKVLSSGEYMTLVFYSSDYGNDAPGLNLTVKLIKLEPKTGKNGDSVYVNMFYQHNVSFNIPDTLKSFKVYDEGGKSGDYAGYNRDTLALRAPAGYVLQLSGSMKSGSYDSLYVYDKTGASGSLLGTYRGSSGNVTQISEVLSGGTFMTLVFKSGSYGYSGLDLTIKLIPVDYTVAVATVDGGHLGDVPQIAHVGDTVSLTATTMNSDYMLVSFGVKTVTGNNVPVIRNTLTAGKFIMPASNVTITPVFADTRSTDITAADGFHLDMTRNRKVEFNFPATVKSFNLYDHGGKAGRYSNSSNDTLVFTAPTGYHFKVTGSIYVERNYDYLGVYDGASTTETVLFYRGSEELGSKFDVGTIETSSNSMTIRFSSDNSRTYTGLDLTVTLEEIHYAVTINSATGGTLSSNGADTYGSVVYLTGSPMDSYHLSDITVVDKNEKVVKSPIYSFDRSKFTMPASNVTVTPTWTKDLTAESGLHLDMLKKGKINATIPAGIKSFNVYDNGGEGEAYESNSSDTLTLNAPTGFYLVVTGSVALEAKCDSLYIYDGKNTSATKLFGGSSATNGSTTAIDTITSSGESLTFLFKSDGSTNYSGLNLKVSVEPITYSISYYVTQNGRIRSNKTKVAPDSMVTLIWAPSKGYMLSDLVVRDENDNDLDVNLSGGWYSDGATFIMPNQNVKVGAVFTSQKDMTASNGLYLNMPRKETMRVSIPLGVKSFKVYDDGGALKSYSNSCHGMLVLNAPEGYQLRLSGSVATENPNASGTIYDYLNVYDGADSIAIKLVDKKTGTDSISAVRSSGRNLTLLFHSDGTGVWTGLDLTVEVVKPARLLTIADIPQQSYTGDSIMPALTIKDGSVKLVENRDYTLDYSSNINSGTASVTVRGMGNYFGDTTVTFTIGPKVTQYAAINILEDERGKGVALNGSYSGDEAIMITDSIEVDYVDYSRKFSTSGFSTIVLPFDVNTSNVSGLEKVAAFSEIKTNDDGRLVAVMSLVWKDSVGVPDTTLKANTPYMVLMNDGKFAVDGGVTLVPTVEPVVRSGDWEFRGTLAKRVWADGDSDLGHVYGFAAEERPDQNIRIGQFVKAAAGAWIRPGRAYLINVPEEQGNHVGAGRPAIAALPSVFLPEEMDVVIEDKENGSTTFVGRFNARTGEFVNMKARTYDLKGRNVKGHKVKGMFIRK